MVSMNCKAAIKAAAGNELSEAEVDDLIRRVTDRAKRIRRADETLSDDAATLKAAQELADDDKVAAIVEKRSRAINVLRKKSRWAKYDTFKNDEASAIRATTVGIEGNRAASAQSLNAEILGIEASLVGPMIAELRAAKVLDVAKRNDPELNRAVAIEMARKTNPAEQPTGNKTAETIADIFHRYQEQSRLMQNDAGAWIRSIEGYVARQSHDMFRVRGKGKEADYIAWRDFILPKLDEQTFDDIQDRDAFLRHAWTGLSTGVHLKAHGADDWLMGFKGPGSTAKKVSQERSLHFKSASDWFDYNERFGSASVFEAVINGLTHAARNTALMRRFGTNPEAAFDADLAQLTERALARGDVKMVDQLKGWRIRAEFEEVSGLAAIPGNVSLAQIGATTRAVISMAKLGGVVLSSLPDIATKAASLRHNGVPLLESYRRSMSVFLEGRTSGEKREIADSINAGTQGILGHVLGRFNANDHLNGTMSKVMNAYFRMNLLQWWVDANKTGVGLALSRNLAFHRNTAFDQLPEALRSNLGRYGFDAQRWDLIRSTAVKVADGEEYVTPDALKAITDDQIKAMIGKPKATEADIRRGRTDLELTLRSYFSDQIAEAMTESGAKERALMRLGTKPGTAVGEAVRFIGQFKAFPVTFITRHLNRELNRKGGVDRAGLFHLLAATTALGWVSMTAKDYAKGREPRQIDDFGDAAKIMMASMAQGGSAGIMGDFLFGEFNRAGGGFLATAAGPALGTVSEFMGLFSATRDAALGIKESDIGSKLLRFGTNNAPFLNIFYTKTAADYLFLWSLQESVNPGSLARMERRVQRENNQRLLISPQDRLRPFE